MSNFNTDCSRTFLCNKGDKREDHVFGLSELHDMYEALAAVQNQWSITEDNANEKAKINGRQYVYALSIVKWVDTLPDRVSIRNLIQTCGWDLLIEGIIPLNIRHHQTLMT